jgi:hypothetical protein
MSAAIGLPSDRDRAAERLLGLARSGVAHVVLATQGETVGERCAAIEGLASDVLPVVRRELGVTS